jgi:hypothetical protein
MALIINTTKTTKIESQEIVIQQLKVKLRNAQKLIAKNKKTQIKN